jgi:hypothetical protein
MWLIWEMDSQKERGWEGYARRTVEGRRYCFECVGQLSFPWYEEIHIKGDAHLLAQSCNIATRLDQSLATVVMLIELVAKGLEH